VDGMKYEVIETGEGWVVQNHGVEEARFKAQQAALDHVAERLKDASREDAASLCLRYLARA
jgi:hypothetical protein